MKCVNSCEIDGNELEELCFEGEWCSGAKAYAFSNYHKDITCTSNKCEIENSFYFDYDLCIGSWEEMVFVVSNEEQIKITGFE